MTRDKQPPISLNQYRMERKANKQIEFPNSDRIIRHPYFTGNFRPTEVKIPWEFVTDGWKFWRDIKTDPFRREKFTTHFHVIKGCAKD